MPAALHKTLPPKLAIKFALVNVHRLPSEFPCHVLFDLTKIAFSSSYWQTEKIFMKCRLFFYLIHLVSEITSCLDGHLGCIGKKVSGRLGLRACFLQQWIVPSILCKTSVATQPDHASMKLTVSSPGLFVTKVRDLFMEPSI